MAELVPQLLRAHLAKLAAEDSRIDGRSQFEGRNPILETGILENAEGSAKVTWGDTIVYSGVKFSVATPYSDRPAEGGLMTSAELRPVAHRKYEPGPPSPQSIELGRVVDRGIRESGCIDVKSLCIVPGESVWNVSLDMHVLSDGGNIFDTCALAAIAALHDATVPANQFDVGDDFKLEIKSTPIMCSFQRVGGRFVYDPSEREELGGDERIHITLGDEGHIHSLQKGLKGTFSTAEFAEILDVAQTRSEELRKMVKQ